MLALRNIQKIYGEGAARVVALGGVDVDVQQGEFIAIMGASGSGKSTCMNILGCLDRPTAGSFKFHNVEISTLDNDARALFRRTYLGFVFQGFNLLARTTALENVELPLIYRGMPRVERHREAARAMKAVGLEGRENHTPGELSGGQQQRVAIARAIVTNPNVLLADEPTGNLDSARSHDIMRLLQNLNREQGLTILMVTHEPDMAAYCTRHIVFSDGRIVDDKKDGGLMLWESVKLALRTIRRNVLRSILTLLGIVIGVGAVIALVTLGQGTTDKVKADLAKLGSNMLIARPGASSSGPPSGSESRSFAMRDIEALRAGLRNVRGVAPTSNKQEKVIYGTSSLDVTITGTEPDYFTVQDWTFVDGSSFSDADNRGGTDVCVIGATLVKDLFGGGPAVGETMRVGKMPCTVVGTLAAKGQSAFGSDQDNTVVMPLRTYLRRIAGNTRIATISVSALTADDLAPVQAKMTDILRETRRVGENEDDDFSVRDLTQVASTMSSTTSLMTGLLGAVAAVSLLVGGIGIMNIMLVSVAERTREIGIRLAIGALANQVLTQFLVEAVVLCLLGGLIGIALGLGLAYTGAIFLQVPFSVNTGVVIGAFCFSGLIGLVFGFFPARRAAKLDPIEALRHE